MIHELHGLIKATDLDWKPQSEVYKAEISQYIDAHTVLLDVGCGRTDYMSDIYVRASRVIGQDPDIDALNQNPCIREKLKGDFEVLNSLADESIDIIVSAWTLEHLQEPDKLFGQVSRLLKKGGRFIALTPNKHSLITTVSRIVPNRYHPMLVKKFWGRSEENTYPAFYQINSTRDILAYSSKYNLSVKKIDLLKDPSYYIRNQSYLKQVVTIHKKFLPHAMSEGLLIHLIK